MIADNRSNVEQYRSAFGKFVLWCRKIRDQYEDSRGCSGLRLPAWSPEEKLERVQALKRLADLAAELNISDDEKGSIENEIENREH